MCESAVFAKFAFAVHFPISAYFCLPFGFKIVVVFFFLGFNDVKYTCWNYFRVLRMVNKSLIFVVYFGLNFFFWNVFWEVFFLRGGIILLSVGFFLRLIKRFLFLGLCLFGCPKKCSERSLTWTFVLWWHFFVCFWKFKS